MDYLRFVTRALNYIEEHLYDHFTAEEFYKSDIDLSEFHVYHLFKSVVGVSVFDYLEKRRLSDQMYRWASSNRKWTLIEAASFAKLDSHRTLSRNLKKYFNTSPRQYYKNFHGQELYKAFNMLNFRKSLNHSETKQHVKIIQLNKQIYQGQLKKVKNDYDFQIYYNSVFSNDLNYKCLYGHLVDQAHDDSIEVPKQEFLRFKGLSDRQSYDQLLNYIYGDYLLKHQTKLSKGPIDMIHKHNRTVHYNKHHEIEILIPIESS